MGGNQESFSEGRGGGVWSKPQAWLGLGIVRREGGSQLREQASQDPSAECAHSCGVRRDTAACWRMVGEEHAWNMLVLWVELCPQKI